MDAFTTIFILFIDGKCKTAYYMSSHPGLLLYIHILYMYVMYVCIVRCVYENGMFHKEKETQ